MTISFKNAALALIVPGLLATTVPAAAVTVPHGPAASAAMTGVADPVQDHGRRWDRDDYRGGHRGHYREDRYYGRSRGYDQRAYARYNDAPRYNSWRGDDGRMYCRRSDGTTGLLVGGAVGGLVGHEVAGRRGDRTLGTILGVAGGALLGRAIDRGGSSCR